MRSSLTRRLVTVAAAALVGTAVPVALAPAASASEGGAVYAEACPEGYKGVIVGTTGGTEFFVCTNILP